MAIQPIDLSTMYTQMDKVSKFVASQDQNAQLANSVNLNKTVQKDIQKSQEVQQSANQKAETTKIKPDAKGSSQQENQTSDKEKKDKDEEKKVYEIQDPLLGQHIDISR